MTRMTRTRWSKFAENFRAVALIGWIRDLGGYRTYYAWGYGGQFIFVIPNLDLVVVTTSSSEVSRELRTQVRTILDLVENLIIQPIGEVAGR